MSESVTPWKDLEEVRLNPGTATSSLGDFRQVPSLSGQVVMLAFSCSAGIRTKGKRALTRDPSGHPRVGLVSAMSPPRQRAKQSFNPSEPAMPDPIPGLGSNSQGNSLAGFEAVAPISRDLFPSMPVCPLDNAHLCEPLAPTAQELGIVIQGLRHHNLLPRQQMGHQGGFGIPEGGEEEPTPRAELGRMVSLGQGR